MAKVIDEQIPNIDTSWDGYAGSRVEEFIKNKLKGIDTTKFGYMAVESDATGLNTMRFFADETAYSNWFSDKVTYADNVLKEFSFYSNKPEPSYTTKAVVSKYLNSNMSKGTSNVFTLAYNCYWGDDPSDKDTATGLMEVSVNGTKISTLSRTLIASGTATSNSYSIELKDYLTSEHNTVIITVSNTHGFSKTFTFNITVYDLQLSFESSYDESVVQTGKWNLRVNCSGADATVYCRVTNASGYDTYTKSINNSSGEFVIDPNQNYALGVHTITIWAENKALNLRTENLVTSYIKGSSLGNAVPALCFGKAIPTSAKQFSIINIPYYFYLPNDPTGSEISVAISVLYDSDSKTKVLSNQTVILDSEQQSRLQKVVISLDDGNYLPYITVKIEAGGLSVTQRIDVESIGVTIKAADECKVYYSMKGRSNSDVSSKNLVSTYNGAITSRFIRSNNFALDERNGFIDGYGMTVRPGKTLTLSDFLPFSTDVGANGTKQGRTIEIEFESGICTNENDIVISCWNNGTGFIIYANKIVFGCSTGQVLTYYPEESRIKVSFVIDGVTTHTRNDLGGNTITENDANLAYLYVNGVIVRVFDYTSANWKQGEPQNIVVGCPTALVELYSLRIYDKALTYNQIVDNYAYDIPDVDDVYDVSGNFVNYGKVSIAKRNDILNSIGDVHKPAEIVSYSKVLEALPTTPIITWNIDNLPFNKNNPDVPINGTDFTNPQWDSSWGDACAPFTVGAHMFNADGTSSNGYPLPYKNFAEIFETSDGGSVNIILDPKNTNKTVTTYSITRGLSTGEKEHVHKVNFASSEGIFNIHSMNMFHNILLKCAKTNPTLYTKFQKQQVDAGQEVVYRKSLSGFPEIGFRKTSDAGSTTPTFLSIYNFINNKYSPSIFGFPKKDYKTAQIWEVDENVNFFNRYITDHRIDGGNLIKSNATGQPIYYARVPKKSPTNTSNKLGAVSAITDNIEAANQELACLKRFHNWVVDCNYHLAERYYKQHGNYEALQSSVAYNGVTYTKDTPAYRKAKFVNEAATYLIKEDAIFYFIFTEFIIGMDSNDKNMSLAFDDIVTESNGVVSNAHARLFLRDTDSRDLFNNSGVLTFKYWHEWNDSYNNTTGKTLQMSGEDYDTDTNTWNPHLEAGFSPVFNGRHSGLMDLIWSTWSEDIKTMYKSMQTNGLNATDMFKLYLDFWKQWCENLYNVDAMGYVNTNNFEKAYGDKLQLSKYFYQKRSRYLDSKNCCGTSVVNNLRLRLYESGKGLAIKHYSPMYASVQWGANNFATQRSIDGDYALIPFGFSNPQNATFDIDDADMITDIKTYTKASNGAVTYYGFEGLGNFYFDANMTLCKRLSEFVMNYTEYKPNTLEEGKAFDLSKMTLLKKVIVRYVKNLNKLIEINSEICEEIDFTGSGIKGVKCLPNQYLTKLVLPSSITELYLTGFTNLTESGLQIQGIDNITKLVYSDCPNINFIELLTKLSSNGKLSFIEATNINLEISYRTIWNILIKGNAVLTGTITINFSLTIEDKLLLIDKFGNIDDINNDLYVKYNVIDVTQISIVGDSYIQEVKDSVYKLQPIPIGGNNIKKVVWSISKNNYATINESTGVLQVNSISALKDDSSATAVITCTATKIDDTILQSNFIVGFYKRTTKLYDVVYSDGSTSDKYNSNRTAIGIVYQINGDKKRCMSLYTNYCFMGLNNIPSGVPSQMVINYSLDTTIYKACPINYDKYVINSNLPSGLVNTIAALKLRDDVLSSSSVNLPIPKATASSTEMDIILANIENANYYPGPSLAFSYKPTIKSDEILISAFDTHNWYIPIWKEINQMCIDYNKAYYPKKAGDDNVVNTNNIQNIRTMGLRNPLDNFGNIALSERASNTQNFMMGYRTGTVDYAFAVYATYAQTKQNLLICCEF